jgi:hypothetical protein
MSHLLVPAAQVLFWSTTTASALPFFATSLLAPRQVGPPSVSPSFNLTNPMALPSTPPPTDGGGQGFSPPAILWLIFCPTVGLPLMIAGVRGWKVTSGVGIGLSLAVLCGSPGFSPPRRTYTHLRDPMHCHSTPTVYASLVNTMGADGLAADSKTSDLVLDAVVIIAFFVGVGCGWFRLGTDGGPVLLGACGGLAVAFMALLLRSGLLFGSSYFVNWLFAVPLGIVGASVPIFRQKPGVVRTSFLICPPLSRILNVSVDLR